MTGAVRRLRGWTVGLLAAVLAACGVNPVTGQREVQLVSEASEIQMGQQNYGPTQQTQGGLYVLDPALTAYVHQVGGRLAAVSDRRLPYEFVIVNDSTPNAWAMPGGKIAVNRGLLVELDNEAELAAVLGHEVVHAAARHSAKGMEQGLLLQAGMVGLGVGLGDSRYADLALGAGAVGSQLISQRYSRDHESESDLYGMRYMSRAGYDPAAAVTLQETFVRLMGEKRSDWLSGLFASHPPSPERVAANRATLATLPKGGTLGRAEYQRHIAGLQRSRPAYKSYDEGMKALAQKQWGRALALADQAIAKEPREAIFYGLRGDALLGQGREREAVAEYDRAVARNPEFYRFHLHRGLAEEQLGQQASAQRDLERSVQLLPTVAGHYLLGELALNEQRYDQARSHFQAASGSDSDLGKRAGQRLVRLELQENPGKYLNLRMERDDQGRVSLLVTNRAPVALGGVALQLWLVRGGQAVVDQQLLRLPGTLAAGRSMRLGTRLVIPPGEKSNLTLRTKVVQAEVQ